MPTLIVLDVSLSMLTPSLPDHSETKLSLAIQGLRNFLSYMNLNNKLELISLAAFSSSLDVVFPFSRDYDAIRRHLDTVEACEVSNVVEALTRLQSYLFAEWGHGSPCQVLFITDGAVGFGQKSLSSLLAASTAAQPAISFSVPCHLIPILLVEPSEITYGNSLHVYSKLVELAGNGGEGVVFSPDGALTIDSVNSMFRRICETFYKPYCGTLICGNLNEAVSLSPAPQAVQHNSQTREISGILRIMGFVSLADLGNSPLVSRHLIIPKPAVKGPAIADANLDADVVELEDDLPAEEGKIPSFCVLLHGSLKVENMAAFCQVADDWFGLIFSWADSKKKSNLMLGVLEPGSKSVPWYGDMNCLGPLNEFVATENPPFPVRPQEKRSYATTIITWSRPGSLQADVQKVVRHARKLPEKTHNFYKELNKLRKAALTLGFPELLESLASLLDRECQVSRGTMHPECAIQLNHAIQQLRLPVGKDPRHSVAAIRTKFGMDE